jgi:hypothetical protein
MSLHRIRHPWITIPLLVPAVVNLIHPTTTGHVLMSLAALAIVFLQHYPGRSLRTDGGANGDRTRDL